MLPKLYNSTHFFSNEMPFECYDDESVVFDDQLPEFQEYVSSHVDLIKPFKLYHDREHYIKVLDHHGAYDTYNVDYDLKIVLYL